MKIWSLGLASILLVGCAHPTDAQMEMTFRQHKADFLKLLGMAEHDNGQFSILWIDSQPHQLAPKGATLPESRWQEYQAVCRPLGIAVIEFTSGTLQLTVSRRGLFNTGSMKGYVYSEKELGPVLPNLNGGLPANPDPAEYEYGFLPLGKNWYLFYAQG